MRKILLTCVTATLCLTLAGRVAAEEGARAVIEKAIKATGGAEKLANLKVQRSKFKGSGVFQGVNATLTGEALLQLPGQMKMSLNMDIQGQTIAIAYVVNNGKGWLQAAGNTMDLKDEALDDAKEELYSARVETFVPLLRDKRFTLEPLGDIKVKGRDTVGVKVASKGHKDISLYFDKKTGLLAKSERRTHEDKQEVTEEAFYSAYRAVDGMQMPMKLEILHDGHRFLDLDVTEYSFPERLDAGEFARPGA